MDNMTSIQPADLPTNVQRDCRSASEQTCKAEDVKRKYQESCSRIVAVRMLSKHSGQPSYCNPSRLTPLDVNLTPMSSNAAASTPRFVQATPQILRYVQTVVANIQMRKREDNTDDDGARKVVSSLESTELKFVVFATVFNASRPTDGGSGIAHTSHNVIYGGQLREKYKWDIPQRASAKMADMFHAQMKALQILIHRVAKTMESTQIDFTILGPPIYKVNGISSLQEILYVVGDAVNDDDHPSLPRDEVYDISQNRFQSWRAFELFTLEHVAFLEGSLCFSGAYRGELNCRFVCDSIRVIGTEK
ncbi:hypothetical protein CVT24_000311 [Panaeolus cyanescens]|uniref:Uncharacterized protein n=1 Tax=Panaeolus cyanescens TaxID=181874 RepID=A0A409YCX5_9AGAR|nr:hypothetical protein CVT24_000311 [Panaeolus cyanescens]